ncbi:NTP transferase domain-containing protein [bacterium]|nr:NTP transferase domain-containing protein [bacterium]
MKNLSVVVLAAGLGKRMGADFPKVLQKINNYALIDFVLKTWEKFDPWKTIVVVGYKNELVKEHLKDKYNIEFALQEVQLGTAHATKMALPLLDEFQGDVAVVCGDAPFISLDTINKLLEIHKNTKARATLLTAFFDNPSSYGRIVRGPGGEVLQIVEYKDCTEEQRKIKEINSGTYIFSKEHLLKTIRRIDSDNIQGEYYLTDIIELLRGDGERISALSVEDNREVMGINSLQDLEAAIDYYNNYFRNCQ